MSDLSKLHASILYIIALETACRWSSSIVSQDYRAIVWGRLNHVTLTESRTVYRFDHLLHPLQSGVVHLQGLQHNSETKRSIKSNVEKAVSTWQRLNPAGGWCESSLLQVGISMHFIRHFFSWKFPHCGTYEGLSYLILIFSENPFEKQLKAVSKNPLNPIVSCSNPAHALPKMALLECLIYGYWGDNKASKRKKEKALMV